MKKILIIVGIILIILVGLFYFRYRVYFSHGDYRQDKFFKIIKGEGNGVVGDKLQKEGLISGKIYFYYYLRSHGLLNKILPGEYELSGRMTIPEIAVYITQAENILPGYAKLTFPEGWRMEQMADRLKANGLDGEGFLRIAKKTEAELRARYDFLNSPAGGEKDLEGFLFPDTYFFAKDLSAEKIIEKMLDNFALKLTAELREEIQKQNKSIYDIITMASIVENEVRSDEDRALVAGLYWARLKIGQPLQSDITLAYVLGEKKKQYSVADTKVVSPYNTYLNKGLPPGPIDNPGMSAIRAAIYPKDSEYNYYLSDPETGETIFAKTFAEHVANKAKYGL